MGPTRPAITVFTWECRQQAVQHGAPLERLLASAPLWMLAETTAALTGWYTGHADPSCLELPHNSSVGRMVQVPADLLFLNEQDRSHLALCPCALSDDQSPAPRVMHPLYHLTAALAPLAKLRDDLPIVTQEDALSSLTAVVRRCKAQVVDPDLEFWVAWLDDLVSRQRKRLDDVRASAAGDRVMPEPGDGIQMVVYLLAMPMLDQLTDSEQVMVSMTPVEARLKVRRLVVRVPQDVVDALPDVSGYVDVLGPTRPMTPKAWEIFEDLAQRFVPREYGPDGMELVAEYPAPEAYRLASEAVRVVHTDDAWLVFNSLVEAGMPADDVLATVTTLAE